MTRCVLPYRTQLAAGMPEDVGMVLADLDAIVAVLNGGLTNFNFNAAAALDYAKLAVGGTPDGTKFLRDDGTVETVPTDSGITTYKKTTAKNVVSTGAKTDLLNGEITIAGDVLTTDGIMLIELGGDYLNNTGGSKNITLELAIGSVTLWNSAASVNIGANASRRPWYFSATVQMPSATEVMCDATFGLGNPGGTTGLGPLTAPSPAIGGVPIGQDHQTVDMTTDQALTFSVTHSSSSGSLSMQLQRAFIQVFTGL